MRFALGNVRDHNPGSCLSCSNTNIGKSRASAYVAINRLTCVQGSTFVDDLWDIWANLKGHIICLAHTYLRLGGCLATTYSAHQTI